MSEPYISPTPLYDALVGFRDENPLRMAMPGHKGKPLHTMAGDMSLDFTELPPTGNLYEPGGAIEASERLWAQTWGADSCLFLTGGSTQGIHTALLLAGGEGSRILVDRVSHRSIHTGMALLDQCPIWLERPWLSEAGVVDSLAPEMLEKALIAHPDIKTVCITSSTYYGTLSDVDTLSQICHQHQARLIVDAAHGAHLFMTGENPYRGADLVITSAHKTLRAPGQSALLFANGFSLEQLQKASLIFATSSPSYLMMVALDTLRPWCAGEGEVRYRETARQVADLRRDYPSLQETDAPLDPCRFTLCVEDGFAAEEALQSCGVWPEMADAGHVVFILTDSDGEDEFRRLRAALDALHINEQKRCVSLLNAPPLPEQVMSPRAAMFSPSKVVPLERAEGCIAAEQLAPYPPGVPVCAPGERISKKVLCYLNEIGYNKKSVAVLDV